MDKKVATEAHFRDLAAGPNGPRPCPFCGESRIRTVSRVIGHGSSLTELAGLECRACRLSVYDDYDVIAGKTALEKWNRGRQ